MDFQLEELKNANIVHFYGNMDVHGVHKIEKSFLELINKICTGKVVFDLSGVDFISSAGLRILVSSLKKIQENRGSLVLTGLRPPVEKVFDILDMNSMFSITKTLDEALA